jgi:pimeloyl-ACP methyl ester carboxylesterase
MPRSRRRRAGLLAAGAMAGGATYVAARRAGVRRADFSAQAPAEPAGGRPLELTAADGTSLHGSVFGPEGAPTLVLVHGWTCSLRLWHNQIRDLAGEFRIVAFDLRGHGRSGPSPGSDYSIEAFASDLDAVLAATVPDGERAVLAGHSMGAMVIVAWAGEEPASVSRVAAAALINTGMGDIVSEALVVKLPGRKSRLQQEIASAVICSAAPLIAPEGMLRPGARFAALSRGASPEAVACTAYMVRQCDPEVRGACGGTLSRLDLYEAIAKMTMPTLVIAGGRDKLTPPTHSKRLAEELPDPVELIEVPGIGHMGPLEAPDEISEQLRALAETARRSPTSRASAPTAA